MTNPKLSPPRIIDFGTVAAAFEHARKKLSEPKSTIFIDAEKYEHKALELIHLRLSEKPATKNQVLEQLRAIRDAAEALGLAFAKASTATKELMNRQSREPAGIEPAHYRFNNSMFENTNTTIAARQALRAMEGTDEPSLPGVKKKGRGKKPKIVDELADMIADDYHRITGREPGLVNDEGELRGEFVEFFKEIFEAAVTGFGLEDAVRKAASRWKNKHGKMGR